MHTILKGMAGIGMIDGMSAIVAPPSRHCPHPASVEEAWALDGAAVAEAWASVGDSIRLAMKTFGGE